MDSVAYTLEDLATQADESFEMSSRKEHFETEKAYRVHIKDVKCTETKSGYLQAELSLEDTSNGNSLGKQWVYLPVFTKALEKTLGPEAYKKKKDTFGRNFGALLRAANPEEFSAYSRKEDNVKPWRFYDAEDNLLTKAELKQRQDTVSNRAIKQALKVAQGDTDGTVLKGADVWLVITTSPSTNPEYPEPKKWNNWYPEQPEKYPAADQIPF